jgi:D-serine deaminase-like pyridoxal phosphate-dependent protein
MQWYDVENIEELDSPALLVYPDRVKHNINLAKDFVSGQTVRLRPHIKTHKCAYVIRLLMAAGITKVKCATISEAELALSEGIADVLIAYQPSGPKIRRIIHLKKKYDASISCLLDNVESALELSRECTASGITLSCFIDINVGQNRTGIDINKFSDFLCFCNSLKGIRVIGMHIYDGHIHDESLIIRKQKSDDILGYIFSEQKKTSSSLTVVIGGTTTFPIYAKEEGLECSPGTFIYWDAGYASAYKEQKFEIAALVVCRLVSIINDHLLCLDLGYKSVSSENSLENRLCFLNRKARVVKQYEEHLIVEVADVSIHRIGEVWYVIPVHICPTVALYDNIHLIEGHRFVGSQPIAARQRVITI